MLLILIKQEVFKRNGPMCAAGNVPEDDHHVVPDFDHSGIGQLTMETIKLIPGVMSLFCLKLHPHKLPPTPHHPNYRDLLTHMMIRNDVRK